MDFVELWRLHHLLLRATLDDLRSLDDANMSWLPKVRQLNSAVARAAICEAVKGAETKEEALYRIATIRCWLFPRQYFPEFKFYNLNSLMPVAECTQVMKNIVYAITPLSSGIVVHAVSVRGNAVYSCLMAEESQPLSGEEAVVYVVFCTTRPWLAVHSMGRKLKAEVNNYLGFLLEYRAKHFQKVKPGNVPLASQATPSCLFPSTPQGYCNARLPAQQQPSAHTSSSDNVEQDSSSLSLQGEAEDAVTPQGLFYCYNCFEDLESKRNFELHWQKEHAPRNRTSETDVQ
ncbi:uncharacterized protein LOC144103222 [Amblyomma americanum]